MFFSSKSLVGTGRKKTGCRRRIVIKEDLVAEELYIGSKTAEDNKKQISWDDV